MRAHSSILKAAMGAVAGVTMMAILFSPFSSYASQLSMITDAAGLNVSWEQEGATMQPTSPTDLSSASAEQSMQNLRATGANYVSFIIPYTEQDETSDSMYPSATTPTDASLEAAIVYAHSIGLHVMLKPHIDTPDGNWRGNINPSDRTDWFVNYGAMLDHYAQIAQQYGVEDFCIGTELVDMSIPQVNSTNTQNWEDLIAQLRKVYSGKLTYSANWSGEMEYIQFWGTLDYIGLSAYYEMWNSDGSVASLVSNWQKWNTQYVSAVSQRFGNEPVVFTEIGYRSVDDSYQQPWNWDEGGNYNPTAQANAYEALFEYWSQYPFFQGAEFWNWNTDPNSGGAGNTDYTPQNKPTQQIMTNWFGGAGIGSTGGGGTTATGTTTSTASSGSFNVRISTTYPSPNATLPAGISTFKAVMGSVAITKYHLYWQADSGTSTEMTDSYVNGAHKEASVDTRGWNWNGNGPYRLTFTAYNNAGISLGQQSFNIYVSR